MQNLDLNLWHVFESVMELRNLNRAAERLGITQSAVSHALRRLRLALDDPLFVRGTDGLRPTERAEQIAPEVREALIALRRACAQPSFEPSVSDRRFTIAASNHFCVLVIPQLISRIRCAAPGITVHVVPVQESLVISLDRGSVDVAVGAAAEGVPARLVQDALYREDMVWISRRDNPIVGEPFDPQRLITRPRVSVVIPRPFQTLGEGSGDALQLLPRRQLEFEAGMPLADTTTAYNSRTAIAIAAQTDLVALVPKGMALRMMGDEQIAILGDAPGLSLEMAMLWHSQHRSDPGHKWLRKQIRLTTAETASTANLDTKPERVPVSVLTENMR